MAQEPESTAKRAELPMRLTRLRVKNFRSIADIDIPLSPLTVLVGPNGSGKSNVVDALRFVRDVFARGLDQAVMDREGMGVIQRWGTEGEGITIGLTMEVTDAAEAGMVYDNSAGDGVAVYKPISDASIDYEFVIVESAEKSIEIKGEALIIKVHEENVPTIYISRKGDKLDGKLGDSEWNDLLKSDSKSIKIGSINELYMPKGLFGRSTALFDDSEKRTSFRRMNFGAPEKEDNSKGASNEDLKYYWMQCGGLISSYLNRTVDTLLFYTLNPADLRQPQQTLKDAPFDEKGRNLAAVLRRLSRGKNSGWEALKFALDQTITGFETLEVESVGGYLATKLIYHTESSEPRTSYIGQESDGTIRILGLLASLQQEPSQPFICIEEPEANIHPGALAVLAGVIDEASLRSQILVTTHSPDMLDHLPVESFLVVEKVGDTTHVGPLDASQIASVRKRLFTPGELFRMEGLQRQTESAS